VQPPSTVPCGQTQWQPAANTTRGTAWHSMASLPRVTDMSCCIHKSLCCSNAAVWSPPDHTPSSCLHGELRQQALTSPPPPSYSQCRHTPTHTSSHQPPSPPPPTHTCTPPHPLPMPTTVSGDAHQHGDCFSQCLPHSIVRIPPATAAAASRRGSNPIAATAIAATAAGDAIHIQTM
jgi:hypothetical protein